MKQNCEWCYYVNQKHKTLTCQRFLVYSLDECFYLCHSQYQSAFRQSLSKFEMFVWWILTTAVVSCHATLLPNSVAWRDKNGCRRGRVHRTWRVLHNLAARSCLEYKREINRIASARLYDSKTGVIGNRGGASLSPSPARFSHQFTHDLGTWNMLAQELKFLSHNTDHKLSVYP